MKDSLNPKHLEERTFIPADNKRFGEAFGPYGRDFDQLLSRLGFKFEVSADQPALFRDTC